MTATGYRAIISASSRDRTDLFLQAANDHGTPLANIEKDFWVCWTLDVLYNRRPAGGPRLLFKGGTSLSKAYALISRFSEDIDITVFRDDLGHQASHAELHALGSNARRRRLDEIRDACRGYVTEELRRHIAGELQTDAGGQGEVVVDPEDPDGQTLLIRYPTDGERPAYIRPVVRLEAGAKSAVDPHAIVAVRPYVSDPPGIKLEVPGVTAIDPARTFWDKIVIVHGLTNSFRARGELRRNGERQSRHYYDLHRLLNSAVGARALADRELGMDCVEHARAFFNRNASNLDAAAGGRFDLVADPTMRAEIARDYELMASMIFGDVPPFDDVMASVERIAALLDSGNR